MTIAWMVFGFLALRLLVAMVNLLSFPYLKKPDIHDFPKISVLIPARNEEKNIGSLLEMLIKQGYNNIEIIVCNDNSEDSTEEILKQYVKTDQRITYFNAPDLPTGWLGKNHSCHLLAQQAKSPYLLFIDADIQLKNNAIKAAISYLTKHRLALLSIFPRQIMHSSAEYVTVPVMNEILLSLLPLFLVKDSHYASLAAANGQFMLFSAPLYHHFQYHNMVKANPVEDISIVRIMKKQQLRVATLLGDTNISCRMYSSLSSAINGFAKNILQYFGGSIVFSFFFMLTTTFGWLIILLHLPLNMLLPFLLMALLLKLSTTVASKQPVLKNFIYALPRQMFFSIMIVYAIQKRFSKSLEWKGRRIL